MRSFVLACSAAAAVTAAVRADEISIGASRDNTLYESKDGGLSNGAGPGLFAGKTNFSSVLRRALIRFDVAGSIPAGSTITSAKLILYCDHTIAPDVLVSLHRVSKDWGEGVSDPGPSGGAGAPSTPGDATWIHTFFSTNLWTNPGGDYVATPSATITVGDPLFSYTWGSTPLMVSDAQGWLDAAATNFGWEIIGDETTEATTKRFESRESLTPENRPVLTLTFTAPSCYANCDASTISPILTVNDFSCFLNRFAAADPYANCDASTIAPILNVNDFSCFLNRYAAGCP